MKRKCLSLLCALPLVGASCASNDVVRNDAGRNGDFCVPLERDEKRRFDEPSIVSDDPASPFSNVALQKGRVGMIAARF